MASTWILNIQMVFIQQGQDGKKLLEEDLVERAPEEFLDPIIGILMREPVLLPSSQITVDKSTIARHLLRSV